MLKRNSKALAIVMAFVFCMSFLAPAFVAPSTASASATYSAVTSPTLPASGVANQNLGILAINIDNCASISAGDIITVSFPSGVSVAPGVVGGGAQITAAPVVAGAGVPIINVVVPATMPGTAVGNQLSGVILPVDVGADYTLNPGAVIGGTFKSLDIKFQAAGTAGAGVLYVYFNNVTLNGASGDLTATILGSNTGSVAYGTVVLGKASVSGATNTSVKSVKSMGTAGVATDTITLIETSNNTIYDNEVIKVKLPNGFYWKNVPAVPGVSPAYPLTGLNWAFAALNGTAQQATMQPVVNADTRILDVTIPALAPTAPNLAAGTALPAVLAKGVRTSSVRLDIMGFIGVDDSVATKGDVVAHVYGSQGSITEQDITVASYGEYSAAPVSISVNNLTAGKMGQKLGTFNLEESLAGSLVQNRVIKLSLPEGVKWFGSYRNVGAGAENIPAPNTLKGNVVFPFASWAQQANGPGTTDNGRTLKLTVPNYVVGTDASKIEFKNMKVDVAPDFTGPISIEVTGTAGAVGTVKVADVTPTITLESATPTDVIIGAQKQAVGDLTIKEATKASLKFRTDNEWVIDNPALLTAAASPRSITLKMPAGARWFQLPTVKVSEGDLQLDLNAMAIVSSAIGASDDRVVNIPVKSESMTASTITVSGILATIDRTVPEGALKITVGGLAANEVPNVFAQSDDPSMTVATVVTPAPGEGTGGSAAAQFKIDSNIYSVNGVAKVMDAAPYIKAGRTYVPVRYLGLALGVVDADVVWDAATQKVTMTLGENVVEMTIGNTTITVNGEAKAMDVAPEISNGRTMLPARYVAEGLGYAVGWDASTGTVLVSK